MKTRIYVAPAVKEISTVLRIHMYNVTHIKEAECAVPHIKEIENVDLLLGRRRRRWCNVKLTGTSVSWF